mgnify:CR=1 FL=1
MSITVKVQSVRVPEAGRADGGRGGGRRRVGRRDCARCREPCVDVRACGLFGDFARRLRVDPLAHGGQGERCGDRDAGDGAASQRVGRD